jgi:CubicO group peptidase (beta-lactamase class C family)
VSLLNLNNDGEDKFKGDKIVWQNFYGFSNVADKKVPNEETIYVLASISKTVTATAVMQLWEKGQLDLDKDINEYLPFDIRNSRFSNDAITTRHLLTHRSGIVWPSGEDPNFYRTYPNDTAPALGPWLREYLASFSELE